MSDRISNLRADNRLFLIAGPCVIESSELCHQVAETVKALCDQRNIPFIFKSSFTKANRLSKDSFTGPGLEDGLAILRQIKEKYDLPILTDVHEVWQAAPVAEVADILQIPAFLCRQTDLVQAAAKTGRWVNIKKGQFLHPDDMAPIAAKAESEKIMLTERGSSFGYRNLVIDFRSLLIMKRTGHAVVFDATHSLQLPGGGGSVSTGQPEFVIPMAKAAVAVGVDGLFVETHPDPKSAESDAGAMLNLDLMERLLDEVVAVRKSQEQSS
jgi:2-dehydro-3-deoxyphosphooctonate aldolase (KDO 8-P synthase)